MKSYSFHGFVKFTVNSSERSEYTQYFDNEYERLSNMSANLNESAPEVRLNIIRSAHDPEQANLQWNTVRFKNLFTFKYALSGFNTDCQNIYFVDHPVSRLYVTAVGVYIQAHIVEPLIYLTLINHDLLLMHAAGVEASGRGAVLFPAHGGTGKTTTSLRLINSGYKFLGDDLILVCTSTGMAYPYPRPLHLFSYNVKQLRNAVSGLLPMRLWLKITLKNILRIVLERLLNVDFLISTRVHIEEILPGTRFGSPSIVKGIIFLRKIGEYDQIDLSDRSELIKQSEAIRVSFDLNDSLMNLNEARKFRNSIIQKERKLIGKLLTACDRFSYINAHSTNDEKLRKLVDEHVS